MLKRFLLGGIIILQHATTALAGPPVTQLSNTLLDASAIFFVSYDGLVNVASYQQNAVMTYANYQYVAWYTSTRYAILARRQLPSGAWSTLQLPHQLTVNDSHNTISLGVSPSDGRIHVAMDTHSTVLYYVKSEAGLATDPASRSWVSSRFGSVQTSLDGLNVGSTVTYPQFEITPDNKLQFIYRSGVSGNGAAELAEYNGSSWANVGRWAASTGTYTAPSGATSTARNLYIHGFTYRNGRLHTSGTWREQSGVQCNSGGLSNHDTIYLYSDDRGRTWRNSAGSQVATSGSSPLTVSSSGIIVDSLDANHGLINQESQAVDSQGQPHIIISYVPGRFTQCVTSYAADRKSYGYAFHVWRSSSGAWTKMEIPFALGATGRSQIVMDSNDNVYVVLPFGRIATASKSTNWTDWTLAFSSSLNAFGEVTVDRLRVSSSGIVSILYQVTSSGTTPSALRLIDFRLGS